MNFNQVLLRLNNHFQSLRKFIVEFQIFFAVILSAVLFVLYLPSIRYTFFVWDDQLVVIPPQLRTISIDAIRNVFLNSQVGLYHPITSFTYMLNSVIGEGNPSAYHITNLIIHILNSFLVYKIVKNLMNNQTAGFLTSILFSVHPVMTESVVWLSARKDLLSTFFMLLAVLEYLKKFNKTLAAKRHIFLFFIFYVLSLLSKVQYVTLPLLLLLIDWFKERAQTYSMYLEKLLYSIPALIIGFINITSQSKIGYFQYGFDFSVFERIVLFLESISRYLINLISPVNLSIFYAYPFKPGESIPLSSYLFSACTIVLVLCLVIFRNNRFVRFGLGWFIIQISIGILVSINREFFIADRYVYGASIGIFFLISSALGKIRTDYSRFKTASYFILICFVGWFLTITSQRVRLWESPEKLFQQALSIYPESEIILNSIASIEIDKSHFDQAEKYLTKAISISPQYYEAIYNRGVLNSRQGNLSLAIQDYNLALKLNPHFEKALFARGNSFMKMGLSDAAIKDFSEVIDLNSNSYGAYQNRAILYGQSNKFDLALTDLNLCIQINPYSASAFYLRGIARFKLQQNGCDDLRTSIRLGYVGAESAFEYYCK